MWRSEDEPRALLMAGRTSRYSIEPRAEYVFGVVAGQPMRARRAGRTHLVRPGQLVAWDPSSAHSGTAVGSEPWTSRLMLVELADLNDLVSDPEGEPLLDVAFPDPVVTDAELVAEFVRLHRALEYTATRLERDERLAQWLEKLVGRAAASRRPRRTLRDRDNAALRRAFEYLAEQPQRNVGLQELATVAGIGKFRLIRLIRDRTGLPPHALQLAHRLRMARRLLEAGESVAAVAASTGFADQSHLHRHFQRSLGFTPGEYRRRMARGLR